MLKVAVDTMGGDNAPVDIIKGAVQGAKEYGVGVILVGPQERIKSELARNDISGADIEILHTDEYLVEGEQPAYALRAKRNASIALAVRQVREGKAIAACSAGPTGGVIAAALTFLGTLEGISRPVVGGPYMGIAPNTVVMDLGGNVDCRPDQLLDFAIVGVVYARKLMNIPNPTVALLSVGAEEGKGNDLVKSTYPLLKQSGLNFIGNVEGFDLPAGKANVVICDGFTGNTLVKFYEGMGRATVKWLEEKLKSKLSSQDFAELRNQYMLLTNVADAGGGGLLWSVNGIVIKSHGGSKYSEIARAIGQAKSYYEMDVIGSLKQELATVRNRLKISNP
jgi:phosphate acyltransferase